AHRLRRARADARCPLYSEPPARSIRSCAGRSAGVALCPSEQRHHPSIAVLPATRISLLPQSRNGPKIMLRGAEADVLAAPVPSSHNPREYTGMKIVRAGALPVGGESGLLDIRDRALALADTAERLSPGPVQSYDIWPQYIDRVLSFIDPDAIREQRIVIDAANGMAGAMLPPVLERLPQVDAVRCYFEPDGTFPNHEPNPLLPENREFIVKKTVEEGADFGVAFDGDADRCFFVDDVGAKLREIEERFGREGRVNHLDGVSVDADDWHMNVRPSNTEPLLRLNLEARTRELMERKRDEVLEVIQR